MNGHVIGNLLIVGLWERLGDPVLALDWVGRLLGARGRVLPMALTPMDITARVRGLDPTDPAATDVVRGQVEVATTEGEIVSVALDPQHVTFVKKAMAAVNTDGTAAGAFKDAEYTSGGKTGTAQVVAIKQNEKYDEEKTAERHRDHSWFIAFAPVDDPKIALAVIVENGGYGSRAAAPIARTMLDYYLLGKLPEATPERDEDAG